MIFIATYLEIREETLNGLFKRDVVCCELVFLKIVFEIGGNEAMPIHHCVPRPKAAVARREESFKLIVIAF